MNPLSDESMKDLVRQAFESEDHLDPEPDSCGSYSSLALLLTQGHSEFLSPSHVAGCVPCGRMLARLLVRRCPSIAVLRQYRQPGDLADIAALGWHISGCRWCKFRLAFLPTATFGGSALTVISSAPILTAAAAAIVLLLATNGWLLVQNERERAAATAREKQWAAERQLAHSRIQALSRPEPTTNAQQRPATAPVVFSLVLAPGVFRDANQKTVSIPPNTAVVRLNLKSDSDLVAGSYDVEIHSRDDSPVFRKTVPRPPGSKASITLSVPAKSLQPGDYLVSLARGGEVLADYSFRVK